MVSLILLLLLIIMWSDFWLKSAASVSPNNFVRHVAFTVVGFHLAKPQTGAGRLAPAPSSRRRRGRPRGGFENRHGSPRLGGWRFIEYSRQAPHEICRGRRRHSPHGGALVQDRGHRRRHATLPFGPDGNSVGIAELITQVAEEGSVDDMVLPSTLIRCLHKHYKHEYHKKASGVTPRN